MPLIEHRAEDHRVVRRVGAHGIVVDEREFSASLVLAPDAALTDFPPTRVEELDEPALAAVLALEPALVLLGTGERQVFPAQSVLAAFLRRGIGIEAMDNAAAARTFNLLAAEGRRVVAVFLLPAKAPTPL
ncbi:MTH938/NDUFAF3 family protein [Chiayiivirga flava]|uniref:Xcc1710-like domain-containing protein n=1 Tax=Chiayiivirga flava TaxID=659595 RepID=A0A7W8D9N7_9GAMM|nr:uncharacterized protein [Chiayiivirga flava]